MRANLPQQPSGYADKGVSDSEQPQTRLLAEVERYGFALEAAGMAVWEWNVTHDQIRWSGSAGTLHGVPLSQLPTSFWDYQKVVLEDDRLSIITAAQRILAGEGDQTVEYRIAWPDNSVHWIEVRAHMLPIADGHSVAMIGVVSDISGRKESDEINRRMAAIVAASQDAIYSKRLDGTITSWNPGAEAIFGFSAEEAIGQKIPIIVPPERIDEECGILGRIAAGKGFQEFSTSRMHKDGMSVDVLLSVSPLIDEQGRVTGASSIARDVTRRKRLEEQLLQSQKMEALGHLAGGIAHDFNNILTVIIGSCDLLMMELNPDAAGHSTVQEIRQSGERAAALTRQLLAFSRRQMMQLMVLNPNEVVREAESMLRRLIGEDIDLVIQLESQLRQIRADPAQLHQVIINLVVNARDSMPRGGRITITTSNVEQPLSVPMAALNTEPVAAVAGVQLLVADNGCGMAAAVRERIFEPFFTTKEVGRGTGLGLSTVQGIIAQSGGQIQVESETDRGTVFRIFFPAAETAPESRPALQELPMPRSQAGNARILLVDDEEAVRNLAKIVLEGEGYQVITAPDGDEALATMEAQSAPVELLITDLVMPRLSGWELVRRLGNTFPEMKVLYISGYNPEMITRLMAGGPAISYLQKPFTTAALVKKVRDVLDTIGSPVG